MVRKAKAERLKLKAKPKAEVQDLAYGVERLTDKQKALMEIPLRPFVIQNGYFSTPCAAPCKGSTQTLIALRLKSIPKS